MQRFSLPRAWPETKNGRMSAVAGLTKHDVEAYPQRDALDGHLGPRWRRPPPIALVLPAENRCPPLMVITAALGPKPEIDDEQCAKGMAQARFRGKHRQRDALVLRLAVHAATAKKRFWPLGLAVSSDTGRFSGETHAHTRPWQLWVERPQAIQAHLIYFIARARESATTFLGRANTLRVALFRGRVGHCINLDVDISVSLGAVTEHGQWPLSGTTSANSTS